MQTEAIALPRLFLKVLNVFVLWLNDGLSMLFPDLPVLHYSSTHLGHWLFNVHRSYLIYTSVIQCTPLLFNVHHNCSVYTCY